MPPVTPSRTLIAGMVPARGLLLRVVVDDLALGDLFEGHRQVVLRARLDQRRRKLVERPLAQLVVVVVDLPGALGRDDHQRVAGIDLLHQFVDAGMNHGRGMVAVALSSRATISDRRSAAAARSSFTTTWSNSPRSVSCLCAVSIRSSITPELSVARSRKRRSSSSTGAV